VALQLWEGKAEARKDLDGRELCHLTAILTRRFLPDGELFGHQRVDSLGANFPTLDAA
jgi:hypothetical protein